MASHNFNRVLLIGNITRDLELRYIQSGTAVVTVGLAVNERFKSSDGERKEKTLFIDVTVWGRQAEVLCEYAGKGRCILVEGTLELDTWTDKDNNKRQRHGVRCERFQFMDSGTGEGGSGGRAAGSGSAPSRQAPQGGSRQQTPPQAARDEPDGDAPFPPDVPDDDIPF